MSRKVPKLSVSGSLCVSEMKLEVKGGMWRRKCTKTVSQETVKEVDNVLMACLHELYTLQNGKNMNEISYTFLLFILRRRMQYSNFNDVDIRSCNDMIN